jgi:hypothetical protein
MFENYLLFIVVDFRKLIDVFSFLFAEAHKKYGGMGTILVIKVGQQMHK